MPGMLPPMLPGMMMAPRIPAATVQPTGPVIFTIFFPLFIKHTVKKTWLFFKFKNIFLNKFQKNGYIP